MQVQPVLKVSVDEAVVDFIVQPVKGWCPTAESLAAEGGSVISGLHSVSRLILPFPQGWVYLEL